MPVRNHRKTPQIRLSDQEIKYYDLVEEALLEAQAEIGGSDKAGDAAIFRYALVQLGRQLQEKKTQQEAERNAA